MTTTTKLKVISLWAGPGAGKSTLAASLFATMKRERYAVELVVEYAKELTYEKHWSRLFNQAAVLAEQNHRLERLVGQVEYAITDSPLPLSLVYGDIDKDPWLPDTVASVWGKYQNLPFFLKRTSRPYQEFGRNETFEQALAIDNKIRAVGFEFDVEVEVNPDSRDAEQDIIQFIEWRKQHEHVA